MPDISAEILENNFQPDVLKQLLCDHTTHRNIFWATHDYEYLGKGYQYADPILPTSITGEHGFIVKPRVLKSKEQQTDRSKEMAEVFTPSWLCNAQNNLVDEALPNDMKWQDYVRLTCLEITCGEAPYLVSRYDATTGEHISINQRVGLLDRKLRVVSDNTDNPKKWLEWAEVAFKNTYGYEWQGDSLLLARKALLLTFIEYYHAKFGEVPAHEYVLRIAEVVSWNLWQMDGLKGVVPDSCRTQTLISGGMFEEQTKTVIECPGCKNDDIHHHNGKYCRIRDWETNKEIRYVGLIK